MNRHRFALPLFAILASLAFGSAAQAESTGLRATVLGGLERTDSAPGAGAKDGVYYGGQIGYDFNLAGLIGGVEGDLGGSSASDTVGLLRAKQGVFASAAVRVALPVMQRMRVFARGGYAYHEINYSNGSKFSGNGFVLGGGAEVDLGERLLLRGEYRYSDFGRQVRGQQFLAGIGIRF